MSTNLENLRKNDIVSVISAESRSEHGLYRIYGKRLFDIAFVILSAPIAVMLVGVSAVLAMVDGGSPFYVQRRVGKGGRIFRMLKIRTMVADADICLQSYLDANPEAAGEWARMQLRARAWARSARITSRSGPT